MASDQSSELSEFPSKLTDIFTKPLKSTATSSVNPAQHTRNRAKRHPVVSKKPKRQILLKPVTPCPPTTPSINTLVESIEIDEDESSTEEEEEGAGLGYSTALTPAPGSSISQSSISQMRKETSWIDKHCYIKQKNNIVFRHCKHCSKKDNISGGTRNMAIHLRKHHKLDELDSIAQKRDANGTAVHNAI